MKSLFQLFLIGFSLVSSVFCLSQETSCGFPGIPQNGTMNVSYSGTVSRFNYEEISLNESIRTRSWPVETRVEYECEMLQRYQLNGSKERICQENGTWTGQLPICDENVAFGKEVLVYDVKNREGEPTSLLTDGKTVGKTTGFYLDGVYDKKLILRFNSSLNIRRVIIHGNNQEKWEENIQNPTLQSNNEQQNICEISRKSDKSIEWSCPDDGNLTQDLYFFHYSKAKYLITEMQVFVRSITTCGYPEIPVDGSVILSDNHSQAVTAFYNCSRGFQLIGSTNRNCTDGIWSGQVPIFDPVTCFSGKFSPFTTPSSEPFAIQYIVIIVVLISIGLAITLLILYKKGRIQINCRNHKEYENPNEVNSVNENTSERPTSVLERNDSFFSKSANPSEQNYAENGLSNTAKSNPDPNCVRFESIYADVVEPNRYLTQTSHLEQGLPIYQEPPPHYSELEPPGTKLWNIPHPSLDPIPVPKPRHSIMYAVPYKSKRVKRHPQLENEGPVHYCNEHEQVTFSGMDQNQLSRLSQCSQESSEDDEDQEQTSLMSGPPYL